MIAIIDYGVGNLFSLQSSLKFIGAEAKVTNNIEEIKAADRIILPGVGAFEDAVKKTLARIRKEIREASDKKGKKK